MTHPIAVVDDDEFDRYILRRILKEAGIDGTIVEFESGDEFLSVITDNERRAEKIGESPPPVFVFLDINMPRLNGFDVLAGIEACVQEGKCDPACLVIMMFSSSNHATDKANACSYSFVKDYIVKPLTKERALDLAETYLS